MCGPSHQKWCWDSFYGTTLHSVWKPKKKVSFNIFQKFIKNAKNSQLLAKQYYQTVFYGTTLHTIWKLQKKSHSTFFNIFSPKMPKVVNLWPHSVTRHIWQKIVEKGKLKWDIFGRFFKQRALTQSSFSFLELLLFRGSFYKKIWNICKMSASIKVSKVCPLLF